VKPLRAITAVVNSLRGLTSWYHRGRRLNVVSLPCITAGVYSLRGLTVVPQRTQHLCVEPLRGTTTVNSLRVLTAWYHDGRRINVWNRWVLLLRA
jgi:hypothetical protein